MVLHRPVAVDPKDHRVQHSHLPLEQALDRPGFRLAYELWQRKRGTRRLPSRSAFDPLELKPILSRLMLIEVVPDPPDFRYRLAGTLSRDLTGEDWTGRSVLDLVPLQHGRLLWNSLCEMQQSLEPQYIQLSAISSGGEPLSYNVLRLPLGNDGETMDMALVVQDYGNALPLLRLFFEEQRDGGGGR